MNESAWPPAAVCRGFEEGLVYATVTASPATTELASVSDTVVPDTATEDTVLAVLLTLTLKEEAAGTMLTSDVEYVISNCVGVKFSIFELI